MHKGTKEPGKKEDMFCGNVITQSLSDTGENKHCVFLIVSSHKDLDADFATCQQAEGFQ